jgi:16S rRNA (uracil1498-N3)-methyltransferase
VKFQPALEAPGQRIVLAETEQRILLRDLLDSEAAGREVSLAIGPEGGWTSEELTAFDEAHWQRASLGPTILRAETAVITAVVITLALLQ